MTTLLEHIKDIIYVIIIVVFFSLFLFTTQSSKQEIYNLNSKIELNEKNIVKLNDTLSSYKDSIVLLININKKTRDTLKNTRKEFYSLIQKYNVADYYNYLLYNYYINN